MKNLCCFGLVVFLTVTFISCASPRDLPELNEYVIQKLERDHMPGMAIAIVAGDEIVWQRGYGLANIADQVPATPETVFGTASITKSFTAAAVLQLHEQGLLDIHDPVEDYVPFPVRSSWHPEPILTIDQVLTHTSGISNGPSLWRIVGCGDSDISLAEWAEGYFTPGGAYWHDEGNYERWPAGTGFQYSNAGFGLLAYIVERVSGMPFPEYIRTHLLEPLEMSSSSVLLADIDPAHLTQMYEWGPLWGFEYDLYEDPADTLDQEINPRYTPICAYNDPLHGAGNLYSTVADLANFIIMIKNGGVFKGQRILSEGSVDLMFSGMVDRELLPPWFADLGMGGYAMPLSNGKPAWGHTGADPGMSSILFFERETDLGVVVLANRFFDIRDLITYTFASAIPVFCKDPQSLDSAWSVYSGWGPTGRLPLREVTIRVIPPDMPADEAVYVNGDHHKLGGWISSGIRLSKNEAGQWEAPFTFVDSTRIVFRVTRGGWDRKECLANGENPPPHRATITSDTTLIYTVAAWQDQVQPSD